MKEAPQHAALLIGQPEASQVTRACRALFIYALLTALATLALLGVGGLVTSHGVGMAVPDWPTTYGYNMFFFPISQWTGGIFYEHSHRLIATVVGVLVVGLTRWLGGSRARLPLAVIGAAEALTGFALVQTNPDLRGAGHFLAGIGAVVLLASAVWVKNTSAPRPLPALGWAAFVTVQLQGLLGGLRVVLFKDEIGVLHAGLAQAFFVLLCAIVLLVSPWWRRRSAALWAVAGLRRPGALAAATTCLIFGQLILGACMRHQHAGLAIPDFPAAYGRVWPATDDASIARYNQQRLEITAVKPITRSGILLQMAHRIGAVLILAAAVATWQSARRHLPPAHPYSRLALSLCSLLLLQALLGAATIWSNKAADLATAHVLGGALSLALGGILSIVSLQKCKRLPVAQGSVPASALPSAAFLSAPAPGPLE